jgi:hypothetical protein
MYMLILNFTYPLRCLRVPPVEYHCPTGTVMGILISIVSIPGLGRTKLPIQWVTGDLTAGVKWPGREADHPPLVPRLRMCGAIPPPPTRLHDVLLG